MRMPAVWSTTQDSASSAIRPTRIATLAHEWSTKKEMEAVVYLTYSVILPLGGDSNIRVLDILLELLDKRT